MDATKGILVLFMVLYHWLNYFVSTDGYYFRYLRFVTLSFIFLAGFSVTNICLPKYANDLKKFRGRLVQRGIKLLCLTLGLNALIWTFALKNPQNAGMHFSSAHLADTAYGLLFLGGENNGSFQILFPISYLLIAASIITSSTAPYASIVYGALTAIFLVLWNKPTGHLFCIGSGILGLWAGTLPINTINSLLRFPCSIAVAFVCYITALSFGDIPYPVELLGTMSVLLLFYSGATHWNPNSAFFEFLVVLGRYSLFAYITQIAILHGLRAVCRNFQYRGLVLFMSFVGVFTLTWLAVLLVHSFRSKSDLSDRLYRFAFA